MKVFVNNEEITIHLGARVLDVIRAYYAQHNKKLPCKLPIACDVYGNSIAPDRELSEGNHLYIKTKKGIMKKQILFILAALMLSWSASAQMLLEFNTNLSDGTTITLPLKGTVNVTVNWGDGSSNDTYTTEGNQEHTYAAEGTYIVSISGALTQFGNGYNETLKMDKLVKVSSFGNLGLTSLDGAFFYASNLVELPTVLPSTVVNLSHALCGASQFNFDICAWDVSNVTDMSVMFCEAAAFNQNIGAWDVRKVNNMRGMFFNAKAFNKNIGGWKVSKVTDMGYMFNGASAFDQNIGGWEVSKVTDMEYMFNGASAFDQNIGGWIVSSVIDMSHMFFGTNAFNQNIGSWDVSNVTLMGGMFTNASAFNQDISEWNVSKVTDMSWLFANAKAFNQDIKTKTVNAGTPEEYIAWNMSQVTQMREMFSRASSFNQDISNWDVSSVLTMQGMFEFATAFNQDISKWDVSKGPSMLYMFRYTTAFDQDISTWDVTKVSEMRYMFNGVTLSTENYDKLLIGWAAQAIINPIEFHAGNSKYSAGAAAAARAVLTGTYGWTITDGGELNTLAVSTIAPSSITSATASSGGNITNNGGSAVTARGVVWGTSANPTIESNAGITTDGIGMGTFASNITRLTELTTYHVRAYATNTKGAEYGDNIEFTTKNATYTVTFTVVDNSVPLTGATITFGGVEHTSGSDGMVTIADVADGTYNYTVSKVGYIDATGQIIVDGGHVKETINLNLLSYNVTLTLVDGTSPIEGATITFGGVEHTSGSDGMLTIADVIDGTYNYTVTKTGYVEATGQIVVNGADVSETITLTLATYGVTLTVVRGDGTPIQDAILTFDGVEYLTATNGKVTITGVINGTYNYTVNMEDYDVATDNIVVDCANVAETIILSLLINNDITIKVVNSEATPIKGVTVGCNGVNNITGDNGVATFLDVANGTFTYTVRMEGYNDVTGQIVVDGADVDKTIILMPKTYSVTFTIVDAEGVPVDAVFIIFGGVEYHLNTGGIATITDAVNGTYDYTVTKGGYVNASGQIIVDDADVEETITLNTVNYSVSFTVVNSEATPIKGVTVGCNGVNNITGDNGVATFLDVANGTFTYTVRMEGYNDVTGQIVVDGADVDKTIILMPKTYSVTFTIVDAEGVPVDAVFIIFGGVEYHLNTGGIATITDAVNGTYDYTVTKGGYVNASGQIIVDDADVEETITLNTVNYSVSFTVVNTDAAPIEGATVTFDEIEYTTNTDGVVVFTDIPEGHSYTYTATKAGYTIETGSIYVNGVDVDKTITLSFTTGIDLNILNNLKVYPSLFSNEITITNADKVKRAIITNANGQCVMIISLTGSTQIINVSEINSGVYFVVFEGANGERIVRKLIKK